MAIIVSIKAEVSNGMLVNVTPVWAWAAANKQASSRAIWRQSCRI